MSIITGFYVEEGKMSFVNNCTFEIIDVSLADVIYRQKLEITIGKLFSKGVKYENKLIFAPWSYPSKNASIISINMDNGVADLHGLRENRHGIEHSLFNQVIRVKDAFYFIPFQYDSIVRMKMPDQSISYIEMAPEEKHDYEETSQEIMYFRSVAKWQERVLVLPHYSLNRVVLYDTESEKLDGFDISEDCNGVSDVCVDGNTAYFLAKNTGDVYIYDLKEQELHKRVHIMDGNGELFMKMIDCGSFLFVIQRQAGRSYKVTKDSLEIESICLNKPEDNDKEISVLCAERDRSLVYLTLREWDSDLIGVFDIKTENTIWKKIPRIHSRDLFHEMNAGKVVIEKNSTLVDFIRELC